MQVQPIVKRWLSNKEAQKYLGMGPKFFERMRNEAMIPFYQIGNKAVFYDVKDLDKLIIKNRVI